MRRYGAKTWLFFSHPPPVRRCRFVPELGRFGWCSCTTNSGAFGENIWEFSFLKGVYADSSWDWPPARISSGLPYNVWNGRVTNLTSHNVFGFGFLGFFTHGAASVCAGSDEETRSRIVLETNGLLFLFNFLYIYIFLSFFLVLLPSQTGQLTRVRVLFFLYQAADLHVSGLYSVFL